MVAHTLDTYRDNGYEWVIFCRVCGQENPVESSECPGEYVRKLDKKVDTELKQD